MASYNQPMEYHQVNRIIKLLEWLSMGHRLSAREVFERFEEHVAIRDIQRDFQKILDSGIPLDWEEEGKTKIYFFLPSYRNMVIPSLDRKELLSLYMLKAYLKTFTGTDIEKDTNRLIKKLEKMAPGEVVFAEDSDEVELLWDQNIGQFDYSGYSRIIEQVIDAILYCKSVMITYQTIGTNKKHSYEAVLHRLFVYDGFIYVAVYIPYHDNYIALALQGIEKIEPSQMKTSIAWKFDVKRFTSKRFGVFAGEPKEVVLEIAAGYRVYFENRLWHSSQSFSEGRKGALVLKMNVPLAPELINWIMGWGEGIRILKPKELEDLVKENLRKALKQYGK